MNQDPFATRVRRVVSASIETVVSAAENVSSSSLLREAVRELDRAEEKLRRERADLLAVRDGAVADQKARKVKATEMADNARYALSKGRDDLARQAFAQQMDLEADAERLAKVQGNCTLEIAALDEALAELAARREKMARDVAAAAAANGDTGSNAVKPTAQAKVDDAVARANRIFEQATGSRADPLSDPATARGLAEIEAMKRDEAIEARLAAMKAKASKPAKSKR